MKITDKTYLKKVGVYIGTSLLAVLAIVYIVYHIVSYFKTDMKVEPVQSIEISDSLTFTAVIFRDEQIVYSQSRGGVVRLYANGEKVAKNAEVANVYETLESRDSELTSIDKRINILEKSNKVSDTSVKNIDAKINRLYYTIRQKTEEGDITSAADKTDELLVLLNRREIIVNSRLDYNAEIAELKRQRELIVSSGSGAFETVSSPASGYFYSSADGYETLFTSEAAEKYSYKDLKALLNSSGGENSGYAVGKIATSAAWYLCAQISRDEALTLSVNSVYTVDFTMSNGNKTDFELIRILMSDDGGDALVVMKTTTLNKDIGNARKQTVSVKNEEITGLRIPQSAVRVNENGEVGVYILKNNLVKFRRADIISSKEGYYIAKEYDPEDELYPVMVHKYDNLIVSGKNIKEDVEIEAEDMEYSIRIFG